MYNNKNIALFALSFLISAQAFSQQDVNLKSLKKAISKTNKSLAEEFAAIKLIPAKILLMQEFEGQDSLSFYLPQKVSTDSFYISAFEVTNKQYREFLEYVYDSIARKLMGYVKEDKNGDEYIDYSKKMDPRNFKKDMERIDGGPMLFNTPPMTIKVNGITQFTPKYLVYFYKSGKNRVTINVAPDIECWKKDYPLSYNESTVIRYFYHPAFDNYPVTGVSFKQAEAYCNWKTKQLKNALGGSTEYDIIVSLPTAAQWEAAAVFNTGLDSIAYQDNRQISFVNQARRYMNKPVKSGGKNILEFDCNFGTIQDANGYVVKDYGDDGNKFTMKVDAYKPNFNGLYNMRGNVAEWTTTKGDDCFRYMKEKLSNNWMQFIDSIKNKNHQAAISDQTLDSFLVKMSKTNVVKGGGWTSSLFYIQPGVNQFYDPSTQYGTIGFRYVVVFKRKEKND